MTRIQQIQSLRIRYSRMARLRRWKAANEIYVRLRQLVTAQLKFENRHG